MQVYGVCKHCRGQMIVLDILSEGYDIICSRCGTRERVSRRMTQPPTCFQ